MAWHHHNVVQERQRAAAYIATARQGVINLTSLDFNKAKEDVQRVLDSATGEFKDDFQRRADDFASVVKDSKAVTEGSVAATAVESMNNDSAVVLVLANERVTNIGRRQRPTADLPVPGVGGARRRSAEAVESGVRAVSDRRRDHARRRAHRRGRDRHRDRRRRERPAVDEIDKAADSADSCVRSPAKSPCHPADSGGFGAGSAGGRWAGRWLYFTQYRPDKQTDAAVAQSAVNAARDGTVALLSYKPDTLNQDFAAAKSHLTGDFLNYYDQFTKQVVTPGRPRRKG